MSANVNGDHGSPSWFVAPGDFDFFAWLSLFFICFGIYGVVTLYAAFDRWAEHKSKGTPLAKTIPTMLTIALLYEIFPLGHFNILLPISAILIALMADWSRFNLHIGGNAEHMSEAVPDMQDAVIEGDQTTDQTLPEAAKNV
ncbi:MAG: hypothetical protein AAF217_07975 [Pseudomonadota bacterium]